MADRRWLAGFTFLLLGVVLLAWLWPLLAGESLFWGLPSLQFYPWRSFAFAELRAGHLPVWNPYNGGGVPLLANYQVAVLYPPNWLHLVLPDVVAMNLLAVGHIVLAAYGMWKFAGIWQLPHFGRAVSTLAFALSGYLIPRLGSFPTVAAAAWMPWILWGVHRVVQKPQFRNVVVLALLCTMLLLAGHAQTAYYVLLATVFYGLWMVWQEREQHEAPWRGLFYAALGGLLGVGLAMVQLVPTAELLARSARADGLHYEWTTNFSYSLARSLTLIAPNLYGTPADGTYLTEGAYFEDAAYVGLLPLVAAVFAGVYWVRTRRTSGVPLVRRSVPFWWGLALISLLIALGKNGFLFPLLYRLVPTFQAFQGPVRWLILLDFSLAMLAGIGASYAWETGKWSLFWSRLLAAGGAGMALIAAFVAPRLAGDNEFVLVMVRALIVLGLLGAGCGVLTLLKPSDHLTRRYGWWQVGVLVVIAFDLFWAFNGLNPTVPAAYFAADTTIRAPDVMLYMPEHVVQRLEFEEFFTFKDYRVAVDRWPELRQALLPNMNMLDSVPMFNNFDPIDTQIHVDAVAALEDTLPEEPSGVIVLDSGEFSVQEPFGWDALAVGAGISGLSGFLAAVMWFAQRGAVERVGGSRERSFDVL